MAANLTLLHLLVESGLGSRRKMADAIRQGQVEVNGVIATDFRQPLDPAADRVTLDRKPVVRAEARTICLVVNKPAGVISTTSDPAGRRTVLDIIPKRFRAYRLYPVGRLDKDSTGLLLLSNDGQLTYQLTHPRFEHEKEYLVATNASLSRAEIEKLESGIELADGKTSRARVRTIRHAAPFKYSITIHEGRKRQIRRMLEELGHSVLALRRVRIGNLQLGNLQEGQVRELSQDEMRQLLLGNPPRPLRR